MLLPIFILLAFISVLDDLEWVGQDAIPFGHDVTAKISNFALGSLNVFVFLDMSAQPLT